MTLDLPLLRGLAEKVDPQEWGFDGNCGGYLTQTSGDRLRLGRMYSATAAGFVGAISPSVLLQLIERQERLEKLVLRAEALVLAADEYVTSDPDMYSHAETEAAFEACLEDVRVSVTAAKKD